MYITRRVFRPWYRNLGLLRIRFSSVPILACSATLPGYALDYIHTALHLAKPTILCELSTDRPNITLFTAPIPVGELKSRRPLLNLIPQEARQWKQTSNYNPESIPKTLIFVDDRAECCALATDLINLFPKWTRTTEFPWATQIIREYHSILSAPTLQDNLSALRSGDCRIMVCTDAVGLGLDVPDIERVIQWKVPEWMTVSSWWQRAGRAARGASTNGLAVLYYQPALTLPLEHPLTGSIEKETDLEKLRPVLKAAQDHHHRTHDSDIHVGFQLNAPVQGRKTASIGRSVQQNRPVPDSEDEMTIVSQRREPHLLWYLNSSGCIREIAMDYFEAKCDPREPCDAVHKGQPCCCRCFQVSEPKINPESYTGFPVKTTTPYAVATTTLEHEAMADVSSPSDKQAPKEKLSQHSIARIKIAVRGALRVWRIQISKELPASSILKPKHIVPDVWIDRIAASCIRISTEKHLSDVLGKNDDLKHSWLATPSQRAALLSTVKYAVKSSVAADLPERRPGDPWLAGDPKPLYREYQIKSASQEVSALMCATNDELRKYDLHFVATKEAARLKGIENRQAKRQLRDSQRELDLQTQASTDFNLDQRYLQPVGSYSQRQHDLATSRTAAPVSSQTPSRPASVASYVSQYSLRTLHSQHPDLDADYEGLDPETDIPDDYEEPDGAAEAFLTKLKARKRHSGLSNRSDTMYTRSSNTQAASQIADRLRMPPPPTLTGTHDNNSRSATSWRQRLRSAGPALDSPPNEQEPTWPRSQSSVSSSSLLTAKRATNKQHDSGKQLQATNEPK
jgi:superfamily II DNA helicase RecQ